MRNVHHVSADASLKLNVQRSKRALLASTAIGLAVLLSANANASGECGAAVGDAVTCTSAGNTFAGGILYNNGFDGVSGSLTLTVNGGVVVSTPTANGVRITVPGNITYIQNLGSQVSSSNPNGDGLQLLAGTNLQAVVLGPISGSPDDGGVDINTEAGTGFSLYVETGGLASLSGAGGAGINARGQANVTIKQNGQIGFSGPSFRPDIGIGVGLEVGPARSADVTVGAKIFALGGPNSISPFGSGGAGVDIRTSGLAKVVTLADIDNDGGDGIRVRESGSADVTTNAAIDAFAEGIDITSLGAVTVNANRNVNAGLNGILVTRQAGGAGGAVNITTGGKISVATASASGIGTNAIIVDNTVAGLTGDVTIVANGEIDPPQFGVSALNTLGAVDIETNVLAATEQGVRVLNTNGTVDILTKKALTITAGAIVNPTFGINVTNTANTASNVNIQTLLAGSITNATAGNTTRGINVVAAIPGTIQATTIRQGGAINVGAEGIHVEGASGPVDILATNQITTQNPGGKGITVQNTTSKVNVETTLAGEIKTDVTNNLSIGIEVLGVTGPAEVRQGGKITAGGAGISINAAQDDVKILSLADITSVLGNAIEVGAVGVSSDVFVTTTSGTTLDANQNGINVVGGATSKIVSNAIIKAGADGILTSGIAGKQEIESNEDITAAGDAIRAGGIGAVKIVTKLNKTLDASTGDDGIDVTSASTVEIDSGSKILADNDGIVTRNVTGAQEIRVRDAITTTPVNGDDGVDARGAGKITIKQFAGAAINAGDDGIVAESSADGVDITQDETITAESDGIVSNATDTFGNKVLSKKTIIATGFDGIRAIDGAIDIETQALITAGSNAIQADSGNSVKIVQKAEVQGGDDAVRVTATDGDVLVDARAKITSTGDDGIDIENTGGNLEIVTSSAADIFSTSEGIDIDDTTGNVKINTGGAISALDTGIAVATTGGNVEVANSKKIATTAAFSNGIVVNTTTGTTNVTVNAEISALGAGLSFNDNTGNITVTQNAIIDPLIGNNMVNNAGNVVYNQNADILATNFGHFIDQTGGKVDLNIDGAIKGPNPDGSGLGTGIFVDRTTLNVEIDTTAKGIVLASGDGISVNRTVQNVIINTGAAIGSAALPTNRGIVVANTDGNNQITTNGAIDAASKGIFLTDDAGGEVANNTTVTANEAVRVANGDGVDVNFSSDRSTGRTEVNTQNNGAITALNGIGLRVNNSGNGDDEVEVNQFAAINAKDGIVVTNTAGFVDVNANRAITALGGPTSSAIRVLDTTGTGDVSVETGPAAVLTSDGIGVEVRRTAHDAEVKTFGQIDATSFGIIVEDTVRDARVEQNGAIDSVANPQANIGIWVRNTGRDVSVDQNAAINANIDGIRVTDDVADGLATRNTTITTTAGMNVSGGDGIDVDFSAQKSTRNTLITTGGIITANNGNGVSVKNAGNTPGDLVRVIQNEDISAQNGMFIDDTTGQVDIQSNDPIVASIDGLHVEDTTGFVTINTDGTARINAQDDGIEVLRTTQSVDVTTNAAITSTDRGILVAGANNVTVNQNAKIDPVVGIEVLDDIGNTVINNNALIVASQDGIRVGDGPDGDALGTIGTTTVNSIAQITSGDDAVDALGVQRVTVNLNGAGLTQTNADDFVVEANSTGADVVVNVARSVLGDANDGGLGGVVKATSLTGSFVNFNNNTFARSNNDILVDAKGGAASVFVANAATVKGLVDLTDNGDSVTVNGNWYAVGEFTPKNPSDSQFGAGADTVSINGGRIWTAVNIASAETVRFLNLETLNNNAGEIFMVDSGVNDHLIARDAAYTGSNNAALSFDILLGGTGSTSDELRVKSTAGVTDLYVNDRNFGPGAYNPDGIIVVRTQAGQSAANHFRTQSYSGNGDFDPATGVIDKGLFFYDLFFRPNTTEGVAEFATEDQHLYAGLPDGEVFQLASIAGQLQNHFHAQVGDWFSRNVDLRDEEVPAGKNWNFFAKAYGSWQDRDNTRSFSFLNKSYAFDVSYDQNNAGMIAGFGYTDQLSGEGKLRTGIFTGYTEFDSKFAPLKGSLARSKVDADGYSLGAYVSYTEPSWYIDGFLKADFLNLDISIPTLGGFLPDHAGPSANNYGGSLEAGYQHKIASNLDGLIFAGLTYVQSRVDDVSLGGSMIDFNSNSSLRGRLGVGLDTVLSEDKSSRFSGGVSVAVVHEFLGDNKTQIFSAGPLLTVSDQLDETLAQISARLEYNALDDGLTAFLKGDYEFNDDYQDVRVSVGVRVPFQPPK